MKEYILGETVTGSFAFNQANWTSDLDLFVVFAHSTKEILRGLSGKQTHNKLSRAKWGSGDQLAEDYGMDLDIKEKEAALCVNYLLKGNHNYIIGVLSPMVRKNTWRFDALRELTRRTLSRNIYNSLSGMARSVLKLLDRGKPVKEKKANDCCRELLLGINILDGYGPEFQPYEAYDKEDIVILLKWLKESYDASELPDAPPEEEFRDWLYMTRVMYWE